jgi:IS30 family transposase
MPTFLSEEAQEAIWQSRSSRTASNRVSIDDRPAVVYERSSVCEWEMGNGKWTLLLVTQAGQYL